MRWHLRWMHSIVFRDLLTFVGILCLVVLPLSYMYLRDIERSLMDGLSARLTAAAHKGVQRIDPQDLLLVARHNLRNFKWHLNLVETLRWIQSEFDVDNAVLYRRLANGKFVYVADGHDQFPIASEVLLHKRFSETYGPANTAWETGEVGDTRLFLNGSSRWFQVNAPIKVGDRVLAVLMLNKFANPVAMEIEHRQNRIILGVTFALLLGIGLWGFAARKRLHVILAMRNPAVEISAGNLEAVIPAATGRDEISQLSRAFGAMVHDLGEVQRKRDEYFGSLEQQIAERREAERALRESEARFHEMFIQSSDAIFMVDPQADRIIDANPRACEMLGFSQEELLSMPMSRIHPTEMPQMRKFAESVFQRGRGWTDELSCLTSSGVYLPAEISASVMVHGGRQCILALVRDISERKQALEVERAQQEAKVLASASARDQEEERFRKLVEGSIQGILVAGAKMEPVFANQALADMFGFGSPEEILELESIAALVASQERQRIAEYHYRRLEGTGDAPSEYETQMVKKNGELFWIYSAISVINWNNQRVSLGAFIDITARKKAEEERALLAGTIEQAGDAIFIIDTDGIIQYANPGFERVTGHAREEALGKRPAELIQIAPPEYGNEDSPFFRDRWAGTWQGRLTGRRKNGGVYETETTLSPVRNTSGEITNFITIMKDITRQVMLEE